LWEKVSHTADGHCLLKIDPAEFRWKCGPNETRGETWKSFCGRYGATRWWERNCVPR
jgi:hypothetical protein